MELGEGVFAQCRLPEKKADEAAASASKADLSTLTTMLAQKWKSGGGPAAAATEAPKTGQVRSFKIVALDPAQKRVEVELA